MNSLDINFSAAALPALEDHTFVTNIRHTLTPDITKLGFYGDLNEKYFSNFVYNLLDFSPYIQTITLTVNNLPRLYQYFIEPLYCYCNSHKRAITLHIQFLFTGLPYNDPNIDLIKYINTNFNFDNPYLSLQCSILYSISDYLLDGYHPEAWQESLYKLIFTEAKNCFNYPENKLYFTFPSNYLTEHGVILRQWRPAIEFFPNPVIGDAAIDYLGNTYDYRSLTNQQIAPEALREQLADDKLFNTISFIYYQDEAANTLDNYIRLFGNGFLL